MIESIFIKTIRVNDPRNPGDVIVLDVHEVPGGFVGISNSYTEEFANYVVNPYEGCQLVKLVDPQGNDTELDPPLEEDELVGFLKILKAIDRGFSGDERKAFLEGISNKSGLPIDAIELLLGQASEVIEEIGEDNS